jgi:phosphoadenosine phosphosulfate reductase
VLGYQTDLIGEAKDAIAWSTDTYPGRVSLSCSFGGPSGMALLDLALAVEPRLPVFCIDTELLFPETYALVRRVEAQYNIHVDMVRPLRTVAEQGDEHGPQLWGRNPDACCGMRKVEPLRRYLRPYDAWLTGVRREQTATRATMRSVDWDEGLQVVKIAPLADWSDEDVWAYIKERNVPVNTLHFEGYPSIGCTKCTRPVAAGEDARAGRWTGFDKTECGIHVVGNI